MDYREKMMRFEQVSEEYLLEVYRVCLYLMNDEEMAAEITRKAFLELYENMENIREDLYRTYLIYYAKRYVEEHKSLERKGGHDGKEG